MKVFSVYTKFTTEKKKGKPRCTRLSWKTFESEIQRFNKLTLGGGRCCRRVFSFDQAWVVDQYPAPNTI
ncbi:MAG: hypothetical protein WA705_31375, partial [Candidatus Ozemobacteraceae bacterium]